MLSIIDCLKKILNCLQMHINFFYIVHLASRTHSPDSSQRILYLEELITAPQNAPSNLSSLYYMIYRFLVHNQKQPRIYPYGSITSIDTAAHPIYSHQYVIAGSHCPMVITDNAASY